MIFDTNDPRLTAYALGEIDPPSDPRSSSSWPTARRPAITSPRFARPHSGSPESCKRAGDRHRPWRWLTTD